MATSINGIKFDRGQSDRHSDDSGANQCNLLEALNKIGVNQNMRMKYQERYMLELLGYEFHKLKENCEFYETERYIRDKFGSFIEGTTLPGLKPDRDDIFIELVRVVEEGSEDTSMVDEKCLFIVADISTPPGYVNIRVNTKDSVLPCIHFTTRTGNFSVTNTYTEEYINFLKRNVQFGKSLENIEEKLERHGPALRQIFKDSHIRSVDMLCAFHNKRILSYNQAFFNRRRPHGWPSEQTMAKMKEQGCLFVPTGHPFCNKNSQNLQWRISFSFQERHLMLNLNDTQHKCYILLKLMTKTHISPHVRLTSYHCKMSLFYTLENTPENLWTNDNLMICFIRCLKLLRKWSIGGFCPSYFIPEVNLFAGKMTYHDLKRLKKILANIIKDPLRFIFEIETHDFGKLVWQYETGTRNESVENKVEHNTLVDLENLLTGICALLLGIRTTLLQKITYYCESVSDAIERHLTWLNALEILQNRNAVGYTSLESIPWALPHISRFLHTSLASHLALKAMETEVNEKSWLILTAAFHFWKGMKSDKTSGRIKLASVLSRDGHINADDWNSLSKLTERMNPICDCRFTFEKETILPDTFMSSLKEALQMCTSTYIEKYVSACIIYLPTEASLTPYPLQFEMYRDVGSKLSENEIRVENCFKMSSVDLGSCVTIDSKVLCRLMAVLLSTGEKRKGYMKLLTSTAQNLKHPETLFNVLGWLESAEQINPKSLIFFKQSWDCHENIKKQQQLIRKTADRNAAKWHLALLLYRAWKMSKR